MSTEETPFVVVPFNMLPSELKEGSTPEDVEEERQKIRDRILLKSNAEMMDEDAERLEEDKAMKLLRALGSDLNINAFACNFRFSDGKLNEDIEEANYLNKSIVERLSVDEPGDDPTVIPFYLTSTEFPQIDYGTSKSVSALRRVIWIYSCFATLSCLHFRPSATLSPSLRTYSRRS